MYLNPVYLPHLIEEGGGANRVETLILLLAGSSPFPNTQTCADVGRQDIVENKQNNKPEIDWYLLISDNEKN